MMSLTVLALIAAAQTSAFRSVNMALEIFPLAGLQNLFVVGLVLGALNFLFALIKQLFHNLGLAELSEAEQLRQDEDFTTRNL